MTDQAQVLARAVSEALTEARGKEGPAGAHQAAIMLIGAALKFVLDTAGADAARLEIAAIHDGLENAIRLNLHLEGTVH